VLHFVKGLFKIQLDDQNLSLAFMANIQELEGPSKTVLDCPTFDKTMLILVNH
jgi:hypothetical protein